MTEMTTSGHLFAPTYTVGVVSALPKELFALRALFDHRFQDPQGSIDPRDTNSYTFGRIGHHDVVAACLPQGEYGTNSAAEVASNMDRSFRNLRFCLLVGIGGGVPSKDHDIRLGDVVISQPTDMNSGVVQYDLGKAMEDGTFKMTGMLTRPPRVLMKAISNLTSDPDLPPNFLQPYLDQIAARNPCYRNPGQWQDILYEPSYRYDDIPCNGDQGCSCRRVERKARPFDYPRTFYGLIASGNQVIKSSRVRDRLATQHNILCLEMEAAGVMNTIPCLVIRGICDYADAHKNKIWQEYAAATAAAYAKLLLSYVRPLGATTMITPPVSFNGYAQGSSGKEPELLPSHKSAAVLLPTHSMGQAINQTLSEKFRPATAPESRLAERRIISRQRQLWNPWPNDALRILHSLEHWISAPGSPLLICEPLPSAQGRAGDLAFEMVDFLQSTTPYKVIYSLCPPVGRTETTVDMLKSLIFQCVQKAESGPFLQPRFTSTDEEEDEETIWNLFQSLLSRLRDSFFIIEGKDKENTERLVDILSGITSHPQTTIKTMIIASVGYQSPKRRPDGGKVMTTKIPPPPPQSRKKPGLAKGRAAQWKRLKPSFTPVGLNEAG